MSTVNLNTSIDALSAKADTLIAIAEANASGVPQADVDASQAKVDTISAKVDVAIAALTPAPAAPAAA